MASNPDPIPIAEFRQFSLLRRHMEFSTRREECSRPHHPCPRFPTRLPGEVSWHGRLRGIPPEKILQASVDHLFADHSEIPGTIISATCKEAHDARLDHFFQDKRKINRMYGRSIQRTLASSRFASKSGDSHRSFVLLIAPDRNDYSDRPQRGCHCTRNVLSLTN
jgi:hypothetical protein